ncbi:MAG: carbohydrate ABC transporter permease [Ruminococcus sp.]|nr:carbohydrate ABC transporter permease [Ruminococcus sp.]
MTALLTLFAGLSALIFLLPTVLTVTNSFMAESEINANYGTVFGTAESGSKIFMSDKLNLKLIPDMVTFSQYITVLFKSPDYLFKFWNSVILTAPIVIFQLVTAAGAAYAFAKLRGKLWNVLFFIYLIIMLMPYQVTLVPNYLVADTFGLLDTRWSIILPGIFTPFAVYIISKIMRRIPKSLNEAAKLDGASEPQIFLHIYLPLCKSAFASVAILVFIDNWNMVEQPLIMFSDSSRYPLSVFLSQINSGEIGLAFAVAVIYMLPAIFIFLYGEEYLVEGIAYQSGVKG